MPAPDWISFWDSTHSIFANARHRTAHFRCLAEDIRRYAPTGGVMLDYGCGDALFAERIAEATSCLILCEPAPNARAALAARFAGIDRITVRKPEDIEAMASGSLSAIVMHSVSQYLSEPEFDALLELFRRLIKPGGMLVLGDVIPRRVSALDDTIALLLFAAREGFYWAALRSLVRTYFSSYWRLRKSLGLSRYGEDQIIGKLEAVGFSPIRARSNIGHNAKRMTFLAYVR
jgi:SAM-dependent methyltransferase